ncbi:hypothetical protein PS1_022595 [Malus domestica]
MSCRGLQRLEILRRWVLLLKEVERLKLSQGSGDNSSPLSLSQQKRLFHARQSHMQVVTLLLMFLTTLTIMKMEDAKPEVSASNNSNFESSDSGLLQDRFTDLCKDRTEWDETFLPTFGAQKTDGTHCSTGQVLGEFSFCLSLLERLVPPPWNTNL